MSLAYHREDRAMPDAPPRFTTVAEFYPYYLSQHLDPVCRGLHFVGTTCVIALFVTALATGRPLLLLALPLVGYGFAWVGHFAFERNKPAAFRHPFLSLACDFLMWSHIATLRIGPRLEAARRIAASA